MTGITAAAFENPLFVDVFKRVIAAEVSTPRLRLTSANIFIVSVNDQFVIEVFASSRRRRLKQVLGTRVEFEIRMIIQHFGYNDPLVAFSNTKAQLLNKTISRSTQANFNYELDVAFNNSAFSISIQSFDSSERDVIIELVKTDFPTAVPTLSPVPVTVGLCLYVTYGMSFIFIIYLCTTVVGYKRDNNFQRINFNRSKKIVPLSGASGGSTAIGRSSIVLPSNDLSESINLILKALPIPLNYDMSVTVDRLVGKYSWSYLNVENLWVHHRYLSICFFSVERRRSVRTLSTFATVMLMFLADVVLVLIYSEYVLTDFQYRWGFWESYEYDSFHFVIRATIFVCMIGGLNSLISPFVDYKVYQYFSVNPPSTEKSAKVPFGPSILPNSTQLSARSDSFLPGDDSDIEFFEETLRNLNVEVLQCRNDLVHHIGDASKQGQTMITAENMSDIQYFDLNWGIGGSVKDIRRNDENAESKVFFPDLRFPKHATAVTSFELLGAAHRTAYFSAKDNFDKINESALLLSHSSLAREGLRMKIVQLFYIDVMTTIPATILRNILLRSERFSVPVRMKVLRKRAGTLIILLGIFATMLSIFLLSLQMHRNEQAFILIIFGSWLIIDVLVVQTLATVFKHVLLPSAILTETANITKWLLLTVEKLYSDESIKSDIAVLPEPYTAHNLINGGLMGSNWPNWLSFNAAQYMFASSILARKIDPSPEAEAVMAFRTIWPKHWMFPHYIMNHGVEASDVKSFVFQSISRGTKKINDQYNEFIPPAQWMHFDEFGWMLSFVLFMIRSTSLDIQDAVINVVLWVLVCSLACYTCYMYYMSAYLALSGMVFVFFGVAMCYQHMSSVHETIAGTNREQFIQSPAKVRPSNSSMDIEEGLSETRPAVFTSPELRILERMKNRNAVNPITESAVVENIRAGDDRSADWKSYICPPNDIDSMDSAEQTRESDIQKLERLRNISSCDQADFSRLNSSEDRAMREKDDLPFRSAEEELGPVDKSGYYNSVGEWLQQRQQNLSVITNDNVADDITELEYPERASVNSGTPMMSAAKDITLNVAQLRPDSRLKSWLDKRREEISSRASVNPEVITASNDPLTTNNSVFQAHPGELAATESGADFESRPHFSLLPALTRQHTLTASIDSHHGHANNTQVLAPILQPQSASMMPNRTTSMQEWLDNEKGKRGLNRGDASSPLNDRQNFFTSHPSSAVQDWLKNFDTNREMDPISQKTDTEDNTESRNVENLLRAETGITSFGSSKSARTEPMQFMGTEKSRIGSLSDISQCVESNHIKDDPAQTRLVHKQTTHGSDDISIENQESYEAEREKWDLKNAVKNDHLKLKQFIAPTAKETLGDAEGPLMSVSMPPRTTSMQEWLNAERNKRNISTKGPMMASVKEPDVGSPTERTAPKSFFNEWFYNRKQNKKSVNGNEGATDVAATIAKADSSLKDDHLDTANNISVVAEQEGKKDPGSSPMQIPSPVPVARSNRTVLKRYNQGNEDLKIRLGEKEANSRKALEKRLQKKTSGKSKRLEKL